MKRSFASFAFASAVFVAVAPSVFAQQDIMAQPMDPPAPGENVDQEMVNLARAGDVNFLADSTQFADAEPPVALPVLENQPPQLPFAGHLVMLTRKRRLSYLRYAPGTFLFWRQPQQLELARALAAQGAPLPDEARDGNQLGILRTETKALLAQYLQQAHGWDGRALAAPLDVKSDDLPAELRRRVSYLALADILGSSSLQGPWFSDKFWKGARLRAVPARTIINGRQTTHELTLSNQIGEQTFSVSLDSR